MIPATLDEIYEGFKEATKEDGRYVIGLMWKSSKGRDGHIFCVERLPNGKCRSFDPQNGRRKVVNEYLHKAYGGSTVNVIRVDNKEFDLDIVSKVLTGQSTERFAGVAEARAAKGGVLGVAQKEAETDLKSFRKFVIEKSSVIENKTYSNLKTGLYYQTKNSFKRGIAHTISKDEAIAFSIISDHIGELQFIRESPLGEVKDLLKKSRYCQH